MARRRTYEPLRVYLNNRLVGFLNKETSGAVEFQYDESWLNWEHALPISLSLPMRETAFRVEPRWAAISRNDDLEPDRTPSHRVGRAAQGVVRLVKRRLAQADARA